MLLNSLLLHEYILLYTLIGCFSFSVKITDSQTWYPFVIFLSKLDASITSSKSSNFFPYILDISESSNRATGSSPYTSPIVSI